MHLLAINPGSTSTKIGIFSADDDGALTLVAREAISHTTEELAAFGHLNDQLAYRTALVEKAVKEAGLDLGEIDGFVGRGGLVRSLESGVYRVDEAMLADLRAGLQGTHASNLGGQIAHALASSYGKDAYIADPVVVDELAPVARLSGHPALERRPLFHALNQKAIARRYAAEQGKRYEDVNVVVAHLGGGISVGAHQRGRVVDVNDALDGDGPFSPERTGNLPSGQLVDLCFSGEHTHAEVKAMLVPRGGYVAYFGTNDAQQVARDAGTDPEKALVQDAMAYQVAKYVGAMAVALSGDVDAVLLTGGIAHGQAIVDAITRRVEFLAPVHVYPGEDELLALAGAAHRALTGEQEIRTY